MIANHSLLNCNGVHVWGSANSRWSRLNPHLLHQVLADPSVGALAVCLLHGEVPHAVVHLMQMPPRQSLQSVHVLSR